MIVVPVLGIVAMVAIVAIVFGRPFRSRVDRDGVFIEGGSGAAPSPSTPALRDASTHAAKPVGDEKLRPIVR
jgi:hypothetical protein